MVHERGVRVLLVAVCASGGLASVVWRLWGAGAAPGVWVPDLAVGWAFLASGFVIGDRRDGLRHGVLVAAVGVAWFLADLVPDLTFLHRGVLCHAALAMPRGRVGSASGRGVVVAGYAVSVVPVLAANEAVVQALAGAVILVSWRAGGARREAGLVVGALLGLVAVAHLVAPDRADANLLLVYEAALVGVAVALAMMHEPAARGMGVTDLVVELGPKDALADLGRRDPTVRDDPAFATAVAAADRLLAANTRLTADLQGSIDDVAASRRRLVNAQDTQRAALEGRLQRGPAGRLDHIAAVLATESSEVPGSAEGLHAARVLVEQARADLTRIAQGLYPAAIADGSLESGLHSIAADSPVPVDLDLQVTRVVPQVAATAYFVAAEAVTNAVRHATPSRLSISVRRTDDHPGGPAMRVEVIDDGRGGADPDAGTGLLGLADRVAAAGGHLEIDSAPGRGTRVTAWLPESGSLSGAGSTPS